MAIGGVPGRALEDLRPALGSVFGRPCEILSVGLDPAFAFHPERQQYHATEILARLSSARPPRQGRLLGVAHVDLFIPILTFVFGEAQLGGECAVISTHRLRQEFYGLPADQDLLAERTLKEAVHELGHCLGLVHCEDHRCAMAASHAVESIDLKETALCAVCLGRSGVGEAVNRPGRERSLRRSRSAGG